MADEKTNKNSKIAGHISSNTGAILNGARVTCDEFHTLTLADGSYVFDGLAPGSYVVTTSLQGFQSESKKITIGDDETIIQNFELTTAVGNSKISGHVYDELNKPIVNGGTVILILPVSNRYSDIDSHGYYEFDNLPSGTYKITTSLSDYEDCETVLSIAAGQFKIQDFFCRIKRVDEPPWG